MCGRFSIVTPVAELQKRFRVKAPQEKIHPRWNGAPGQKMPVIEMGAPSQMALFQWGLVPHWARDPKIGYKMINARSETLKEKPSFRASLRKSRCLVLADGFFEWDKKTKPHAPYYIALKNHAPFAFAGLSGHWESQTEKINSFTIITTTPNRLVEKIHDRMPMILLREDENKWLDPLLTQEEALELLKPYPETEMTVYPVSSLVNNPRNNLPDIIKKKP